MNQNIVEKLQIAQAFLPVDMAGGAQAGDWVSLKNYGRCAIVIFKGVGTAGEDPVITVEQASDVSGTGAKALAFTRVDKKQAATNLLAVGTFTTSTADSPAALDTITGGTFTNTALAEQAAILVIDIKAEDLDIDGGFDCVRVSTSDVAAAQLGAGLYLLHEPRFATAPLPSAIAD